MDQVDGATNGGGMFSGSPSKQSQRVVTGLRAVHAVADFLHVDVDSLFARLVGFSSPPPWLVRGLQVSSFEFAGMRVWTMRSATTARTSDHHIVCLHGGGYVHDATTTHWRHYVTTARDTGANVIVPIYPLAPKGTAETVVPKIVDLISSLVSEHGAEAVSIYGDSAGGGLALAASQELVRRGAPSPARMVLISPWLDVTMTDPEIDNIDDPALNRTMLKTSGLQWAGDLDPMHPWVSPLFGSLDGLPSTVVYSSSLDLLCVDTIRLQANAIAEGVDITFVLRKGLIHDWVIGPLPEAVAVRPDIYRQLTVPVQ
jgi:acetyl esterase/lipase